MRAALEKYQPGDVVAETIEVDLSVSGMEMKPLGDFFEAFVALDRISNNAVETLLIRFATAGRHVKCGK